MAPGQLSYSPPQLLLLDRRQRHGSPLGVAVLALTTDIAYGLQQLAVPGIIQIREKSRVCRQLGAGIVFHLRQDIVSKSVGVPLSRMGKRRRRQISITQL
jgi:hypothetical protein